MTPVTTDILVEDSLISKIEPNIELVGSDGEITKVIDCEDKLISPGFVNTHHHLWQTQYKGRHADQTLVEYMPSGNFTGSLYSLEDAFWGQLGGAMEAVDAGTTTVVDHSSLNLSPEYREPYRSQATL